MGQQYGGHVGARVGALSGGLRGTLLGWLTIRSLFAVLPGELSWRLDKGRQWGGLFVAVVLANAGVLWLLVPPYPR